MASKKTMVVIVVTLLMAAGFEESHSVFTGGYLTDPPAIDNPGMGGYTALYTTLIDEGYNVDRVTPRELQSGVIGYPDKSVLVIASPDRAMDANSVKTLLSWARQGGLIIVLDELGTTTPLLRYLNLRPHSGHSLPPFNKATCTVGGKSYTLLLDVYAVIEHANAETLCVVNHVNGSTFIFGAAVRLGKGKVVFIGDSTILANIIYYNANEYFRAHLGFLRELLEGRNNIIFLEDYRRAEVPLPIHFLATTPGGVLRAAAHALVGASQPPLYRAAALLVSIIAALAVMGVAPSLPQRRKERRLQDLLGDWQRV